jgi:two-component system copper resistance phosphate regulon response regulator CusR
VRVLIVEDEVKTARYLGRGLGENGFAVDTAGDGASALHLARTCAYALVVLDVMLPRLDGWSVLRELRRSGQETPVIILSARDSVEDRVKGLELGADDYLIKPFSFSELLARVRTVLRRGSARQLDVIRIGDLEVDVARQRVSRSGRPIRLTAKEFALLALLGRREGEVLSRTLIAEQVWDLNFDSGTNVVEVLVRRLRAKIDDPFPDKLIHTQRGRGYVLEAR